MPKPVWLNSQLTQLVAAVIVAVIGSTAIQIKFTARANPFTSQMGDHPGHYECWRLDSGFL